ncbi:MAG: penicillin acylase family protein [Bryobacteraceae bacterium]|nr:penicillin acylase family protein [Bryobacteraceae bacterium]MDW8379599.1 penicillin acylase family protein [Bryobacterales bacterium]
MMFMPWFLLLTPVALSQVSNFAQISPRVIRLEGLKQRVEILRDKWGVPHIYAQTSDDLFFAQGYIAARDRLFQMDLWRRANSGHLAEILGPRAVARDRIARLVRYRGNWEKEWLAYAPDTKAIVTAFVAGVNAYIRSLDPKNPPLEFRVAGYLPGLWRAEDCVARIAGLLMTRNLVREVERAIDVRDFGIDLATRVRPPDPLIPLQPPAGLDLKFIHLQILRDYNQAVAPPEVGLEPGSNNWVVDGTRTMTGKPLLANDPHRPISIPSLRKTVHLVGPGWNAFGAGEPALPGIALGHNEEIAFGFTIVNMDQQDLYVERTNPTNPDEYWSRNQWRKMEVERDSVAVKGQAPQPVELRYTEHGPVIYEDRTQNVAYALKWVGAEAGGAGYLAGLSLARAKNWSQFLQAVARYRVPSENLVYADRAGNIGWVAAGAMPVRKNWSGLFPVPGDRGEYEWSGYLSVDQLPKEFNPPRHWIATANHKILPPNYPHQIGYEWALPYRYQRLAELLSQDRKFSVEDFQRMQLDVTSLAARQFQKILRRHRAPENKLHRDLVERFLRWDCRMTTDAIEPTLFAVWMNNLPRYLLDSPLHRRMDVGVVLRELESGQHPPSVLWRALESAAGELEKRLGKDPNQWRWGRLHQVSFQHPLRAPQLAEKLNRGPVPRPGDANTVNNTGGADYQQTQGASYRQILDLADWDRSVMTNVPGESGDPDSPHYSDLLSEWAEGRYHPMLYSRKAIESATVERIELRPAR